MRDFECENLRDEHHFNRNTYLSINKRAFACVDSLSKRIRDIETSQAVSDALFCMACRKCVHGREIIAKKKTLGTRFRVNVNKNIRL